MRVREAVEADIPQLVDLRLRMFAEVAPGIGATLTPRDREVTDRFFRDALGDGSSKTWVAEAPGGQIVATGTLTEFRRPPYPGNLQGLEAYVLNMYTLPDFRRQGLSARIMEQLMGHARERGYAKLWLHASDDGRTLYERFGFAPNPRALEWHPPTDS
jgi:GNAT superfamily N-acetyltransferase